MAVVYNVLSYKLQPLYRHFLADLKMLFV